MERLCEMLVLPYCCFLYSSLTMTMVSNVIAFGMMPLNIWLYCRSWTNEDFQIPFAKIMISLVMTVGPAAVGMLVRWKWEKVSHYVIKVS